MANPSDDELQLNLGGVEDESVCQECAAAERVHYASSVAEAVVVFANRLLAGETDMTAKDRLWLTSKFMGMLERRERGCLCENCYPELHE